MPAGGAENVGADCCPTPSTGLSRRGLQSANSQLLRNCFTTKWRDWRAPQAAAPPKPRAANLSALWPVPNARTWSRRRAGPILDDIRTLRSVPFSAALRADVLDKALHEAFQLGVGRLESRVQEVWFARHDPMLPGAKA